MNKKLERMMKILSTTAALITAVLGVMEVVKEILSPEEEKNESGG